MPQVLNVEDFKQVVNVPEHGIVTNDFVNTSPRAADLDTILIETDCINLRIEALAKEIAKDYKEDIYAIVVLKGALPFFTNLMHQLSFHGKNVFFDFYIVSSYDGTTSTKAITTTYAPTMDLKDKNVLIVEDIVDTGLTLAYVLHNLNTCKPTNIRVCSLLDKPSRREISVPVNYTGFRIPDLFVVGYGLDYNQQYRELNFIAVRSE